MVCISDGRANVPLSVSNGEPVRVVRSLPRTCIFIAGEPILLVVTGPVVCSPPTWVPTDVAAFFFGVLKIFVLRR